MTLRAFLKNRQGGVAPMLALAAIPLFGFVGAAIDYSRASSVRTAMQGTLDATALMLAKTLQMSPNTPLASTATAYFNGNFARPEAQNVQVTVSQSQGSGGTSLTLKATSSVQTRFMNVMGFSVLPITVHTNVLSNADGLGCVLALDGFASGAATGQGSTLVNLNGCSLYDNSTNATALVMGGSARLTALSVGVVGGVSGASNITTTQGIRTGMGAVKDPYSDVNFPAFFSCTEQDFTPKKNVTIDPGVYCGGITVHAQSTVTLNPGIYYLDGGDFTVNGGGTITGTGVTLVFTKKNSSTWATATINGNAVINLTAPLSGPMAGIVVFGDRNVPIGTAYKLNGGSTQYFGGAIYLPTGAVDFIGGAGTSSSCTQLIGNTVSFSGNSSFALNCSGSATKPFGAMVLKLTS